MPLTFKIDHERRLLLTTVEGEVHLADVVEHLTQERQAKGLGCLELVDATRAQTRLSAQDIREIVALLRKLASENRLGPTAVVIPTDVGYGMMRMLGILVEDFTEIEPFRNAKPAEVWLAHRQAKA